MILVLSFSDFFLMLEVHGINITDELRVDRLDDVGHHVNILQL